MCRLPRDFAAAEHRWRVLIAGVVNLFSESKFCKMKGLSGSNSVVECDLAKVEVAGSNPVSRSRFICYEPALRRRIFLAAALTLWKQRRYNVVREIPAKIPLIGLSLLRSFR
jgi:hypothetical protein